MKIKYNKSDNSIKINKGFTLVELIITIIILAILGAIAFFALNGYSKQSRDATRISDISTMKTGLEVFHIDAGKYPIPTNGINVLYSGSIVWTQGIYGKGVFTNVDKIDKIPKDPLTESFYTLSVNQSKNEFQLGGILETDNLSFITKPFNQKNIFTQVAEAGTLEAKAIVKGNYNGLITKTLSGSTCNGLAIPSIIAYDIENNSDLQNISDTKRFVRDGYNNLPDSFSSTKFKINGGFDFQANKLLVYTDTGSCEPLRDSNNETAKINLINGLKDAYSNTTLKNDNKVEEILSIDTNTYNNQLHNTSAAIINNTFGGNIAIKNDGGNSSGGSSSSSGGGTPVTNPVTIDFIEPNGATYSCSICT